MIRVTELVNLLFVVLVSISVAAAEFLSSRVIYAVNCGGQAHTDVYGVRYRADPLKTGIASDYGSRLSLQRVDRNDAILYQTERYDTRDFTYTIPMPKENGEYTLVLKFCEVYFLRANEKVFDVLLNGRKVISLMDIFKQAGGPAIAYDELLTFYVQDGMLQFAGSDLLETDQLKLTFAKGPRDNPKINAFYVYHGPKEDIPPLPEMEEDIYTEETGEQTDYEEISEERQFDDEPLAEDPYAEQDTSHMFIPFLVAFACFFPVLFCLCKL